MTSTQRLAKAAGIVLLERGGIALVKSADASAFLAAATAAEIRILAIDGFIMEDGGLFADEAAACDLTEIDELDVLASEAEDFLAGFGPADDLYWDFVLDED